MLSIFSTKKKRGTGFENLILIAWLLVFLTIFFLFVYGPEGFTKKLVDAGKYVVSFLPGQERAPKKAAQQGLVDSNVLAAYNSMINGVQRARSDSKEGCLISYYEFPHLKTDKGEYYIVFEHYTDSKEGGTNAYILNEAGQKIGFKFFKDLEPCIVAGEADGGSAAQNFYDKYVNPPLPSPPPEKKLFNIYPFISLNDGQYASTDKSDYDADSLQLDTYITYVNGNKISLLYRADKNHVCFIATDNNAREINGDGIGYEHIKEIFQEKPPNLPLC